MKLIVSLFALLLCLSALPALADPEAGTVMFQSAPAVTPQFSVNTAPSPAQAVAQAQASSLPDGLVQALADHARLQLPNMTLPDGKPVGPETPQEKKERFLIPFQDLQRVAKRGGISAYAYLCGLDWENRSYLPFLSAEVRSGRWTDKEMVYISLMHQFTQGAFIHNLKDKPCPADVKARLDLLLPQAPANAAKTARAARTMTFQNAPAATPPAAASSSATPVPVKWPHP